MGFVGFPFGVALPGIVLCILGEIGYREPVNLYKSGAGWLCKIALLPGEKKTELIT
jgi:hypothetical protein